MVYHEKGEKQNPINLVAVSATHPRFIVASAMMVCKAIRLRGVALGGGIMDER